jgi:PglZ domain
MSIKEFIQDRILLPRLKKKEVLVIYDPDMLFHSLCLEMETQALAVVDASDSSILSRETALKNLKELGTMNGELKGLLVYVPVKLPETEEEKQKDPFALYSVCGNRFPDGVGDEYLHICLKAKPDHGTEIRRIFSETPIPSFAVIDAVGAGKGWPNLQVALKVDSASDILFALLSPTDQQKKNLETQEGWISEAKELFSICLGLKLITRGKTWSSISDELWRFLLFSEFVFDLPPALPETLVNVPRANDAAQPVIEDLCERLRNDKRSQASYIERAQTIEKELDLPSHCKTLNDFGVRDTFPFEEKSFLRQGMDALKKDDTDTVRYILNQHTDTVWTGVGERQARWGLVGAALSLCEACEDCERQLPDHSSLMVDLIDFYLGRLREVDRLQREFEQSVSDIMDAQTMMDEMIEKARNAYRKISSRVQNLFVRHLEKSSWPPLGRLSNGDVFDTHVAPKLQESGYKIAYFMIDSLRYELGVALEKQLAEEDVVQLYPAVAHLPSVTTVGMASLLPGAGAHLSLIKKEDKIVPVLDGLEVATVKQRMDVFKKKYGPRFQEMILTDFVRTRKNLSNETHLLVLRGTEIDTHLETAPETALRFIHDTLKRIRVGIHKLKSLGFNEVVIATDHGFFLNMQTQAGDVCAKPTGDWLFSHNRLVLGDGPSDTVNFVLPAAQLGIRGDFNQVGGPRGLVPYRAGELYFHGGASLQECIVPVIAIRLGKNTPEPKKPKLSLAYKNGAKYITTRLPVVNLHSEDKQMGLFPEKNDIELLIEAHNKKGEVVGEAKAGGVVNPATGTISLIPGDIIQVTLRMQEDFEGGFMIKVMDPSTFTVYCKLELKTDYLV